VQVRAGKGNPFSRFFLARGYLGIYTYMSTQNPIINAKEAKRTREGKTEGGRQTEKERQSDCERYRQRQRGAERSREIKRERVREIEGDRDR